MFHGISKQELMTVKNVKIESANHFPQSYYKSIVDGDCYDLYTPILKGRDWLYELTIKYQPKAGEILANGSELIILGSEEPTYEYFNPVLAQEINGRMIEVFREFGGSNPSDEDYTLLDNRMISLPEELRAAYYHRFIGLSVIDDPVVGTGSNLLMKDIGNWGFIDTYLGRIRKKKKYLPFIEEVIPDVKPKYKHDPYFNFSCFLNVGNHQWGDVFFVKTHIRDGVIYYIRDHDIENMMILSNPIQAMDEYHAHVLMRKEGRFDFMPYASPM